MKEVNRASHNDRNYIRRVFLAIGLSAAAVVLLFVFWYAASVFLLVFAGILFAIFLRSLADAIGRYTPLSSGWSLALVILFLAGLIGVGSWFLAADIATQMDELIQKLPETTRQIENRLGQYAWGRSLLDQVPQMPEGLTQRTGLLSKATGFFSTTFGMLANFFIVLIIGLYLAADPGVYRNGFVRLLPPEGRGRAGEVLSRLGHILWWWLIGRMIAMAVIGLLTTIGLSIIGVPLALALGLLAGVLNFIPYIGPILSIVPPLLMTLTQGPTQILYVVLLYLLIQGVESYLLTPLVDRRTVRLPPALGLTAQVLFGILFGLPGVILASPLTAAILVVVNMLYIEDMLGDAGHPEKKAA